MIIRTLSILATMLMLVTAVGATANTPEMERDVSRDDYRRVFVTINHIIPEGTEAYEFRFSDEPIDQRGQGKLHSKVMVGDTTDFVRRAPSVDLQDCWSGGLAAHRNEEDLPVISAGTTSWSCSLTGLRPATDQWISVAAVGADGQYLSEPGIIKVRTDIADQRTPAPDTRPLTFALGSIVISIIVLLSYLRYRDMRRGNAKSRLAYVYIAPALIGLITLTFYPILYGIWLSVTDADQSHLGDESWVGLANFATVLTSPGLIRVTGFTLIWSITNVAAHVGIGLLLAYTLTRPDIKGRTAYRTILLLPWAIPGYISVLAWNGMLQPDGLINLILGTELDFIATANSARVSVILVNIWLGIPFMMMVLSGALQSISTDMYEAAELDGVSHWDQFRYLTLPSLKGTLVPISLLGFIWTFNTFNTIYLMTRGTPYIGFGEPGATDTLVTYVFSVAFDLGYYGIAAAWSVAIFLLLIGFSYVYIKRSGVLEVAR